MGGGSLATRQPGARLVGAFLIAGLGLALAASGVAAGVGADLASLPVAVLVASALLLAPILVPLAAVLPLASAWMGTDGASPRALGRLLALSTAGSLIGTLGAALVLVPQLGLRTSFLGLGALLAGAAALLAARPGARIAALSLAAGLLAVGLPGGTDAAGPYVRETASGRVEVRRTARGAELRVDGILQGTESPLTVGPGSLLRGRQYLELLPFLHPTGRRAVQVGLGSGLVARVLETYGIEVESIDVHAALVDLARSVLGYEGRVHVGDGRVELRRMTDRFDFVVLDAFHAEVLPAHLLSQEAFLEAKTRMREGGVLALHLIGRPEHVVTSCVYATLGSAFTHRLAVRSGVDDELQDIYLFASDARLRLPAYPELAAAGWIGNEVFRPTGGGAVLTDDRNPLDSLNEPLARALRAASRRTRP